MDSKHDMIESCVIFLLGYLSTYCEACSQVPLSSMHFYMKGHVIEERRVSGLSKCVYNCMVTTDCLSFNFEINTNWCQLNSADVVIGTEELTTTSDQMFFSNIRDWPTVRTSIYGFCFSLSMYSYMLEVTYSRSSVRFKCLCKNTAISTAVEMTILK